jgi:hypothetical protein
MSTPNKENVVERMEAFLKALSEKDVNFLVSMAQEGENNQRIAEDKE